MSEIKKEENPKGDENPTEGNVEELNAKIAELEGEKQNLVGEITDDRKKRQEISEELELTKTALEEATRKPAEENPNGNVEDVVKQAVEKTLAERDASTAKSNKIAAVERFVAEDKRFHESNDPTGKIKEALEEKLKMFNTESLKTEDQFYSVVKDAARLLGNDTVPQAPADERVEIQSTPQSSNAPRIAENVSFSEGERRLMRNNNWTEERFTALKQKNPSYIENLVRIANTL